MLNISDAQPGSSRGRSGGGFFSYLSFRCQPCGSQKKNEGESLFRNSEANAKLSAAEGADPIPRSFHLPQCKFDQGGKRYSLQGNAPALSQRLKQLEVNPNAPDDYGRSLLHLAVLAGNAEAVSFLVAALRVEVNALDSLERTPLHWISSISKPNMEIAQYLLKNGADVNAQDIIGNTPLHHATSAGGHLPIISELLHKGANPSALNNSGLTPLAVAIGPNLVRLEALLGPSTASPTPEPQHMDRSRSPSPSRPPRAGRGRSQTPKKSAHHPRTRSKLGSSVGRLIAFVLGGPDGRVASPDRSEGQAEEEHQDGAASFDTANQQAARGLDLGQLAVALKEHAPQPGRLELPLPATPQLVDGAVPPGHRRSYRPHRRNDSKCSYKGQSAPPAQKSAALSRKTDPRTFSSSSFESLEIQGLDVSSVPAAPSAGDKKQWRPSKDSTLTGFFSCQSNASPTGSRRSSSCSPVETNKLEWADRMITLLLDRPKANSASSALESESEAVVAPRPRTGHSPRAGSFRAGPPPKFPSSPSKAPGQKPGMKPLASPALVKKSQSVPPPRTVPEAPAFKKQDQMVLKRSKERPPLPLCPPPRASRKAQSTPPKKRGGPPPASPPPRAGNQPPATPPRKQMMPPATPPLRRLVTPMQSPLSASKPNRHTTSPGGAPLSSSYERALRRAPSSSARASLFPKAELAEARGGFSGDCSEGSNHLPKPLGDLSRGSPLAAGMPRAKSAAPAMPRPQPAGQRMLRPTRKGADMLAPRQAHPRGAASLPPGARLSNAARAVRSSYGPELSLVDVPYALPAPLRLDLTLRPAAPGGAGVDPGKARAPGGKARPALLGEGPAARQLAVVPTPGAVTVGYAAGTGTMAMPGPRRAEGRARQASDFAPFMERGRAEGGGACTCRPGGPPCAHGAEGGGKAAKWDVAARIRTEEDRLAALRAERLAKLRARELAAAGQQGSDGTASVSSEEEEEGEEA